MQLAVTIEERYGVEIPLDEFQRRPTDQCPDRPSGPTDRAEQADPHRLCERNGYRRRYPHGGLYGSCGKYRRQVSDVRAPRVVAQICLIA